MGIKKIGIVVADVGEYKPLLESAKKYNYTKYPYFDREGISFSVNGIECIFVLSGVGKVNATAAAMYLIANGCECVLNYGLSGGLGENSRGGLIIPQKFLEHDFDFTLLGYLPCQKPDQDYYVYEADNKLSAAFSSAIGVNAGGIAVSGDSFICEKEKADKLTENFGASSCDMETAAIAAVCRMAQIPFCALRRISDSADENAVEVYRDMNENDNLVLSDVFLKCLEKVCE